MGVGRSGTTAIYSLLQEVLEKTYPGDTDYVYEPFLWDRETFNDQYSRVKSKFRYVSAVSIEGMYHNRQIPLLLNENSAIPAASRDWLKGILTASSGKNHYLGKMVRANGRVSLIREIAPQMKIIFLIRNPVDVVNSATQSFSFYGPEFHPSDFHRFRENVRTNFQASVANQSEEGLKVETEYAYWFYSNCSFLEYAKKHSENILTISYEAFVEQRSTVIAGICEFLELDYQDEYTQRSVTAVGPVRQGSSILSAREYEFLFDRLGDYSDLLNLIDIKPIGKIEDLVKTQTSDSAPEIQSSPASEFSNGLSASIELRSAKENIASQLNTISELRSSLKELRRAQRALQDSFKNLQESRRVRFVFWLLSPLDKIRAKFWP